MAAVVVLEQPTMFPEARNKVEEREKERDWHLRLYTSTEWKVTKSFATSLTTSLAAGQIEIRRSIRFDSTRLDKTSEFFYRFMEGNTIFDFDSFVGRLGGRGLWIAKEKEIDDFVVQSEGKNLILFFYS